jgi:hypothetical protein
VLVWTERGERYHVIDAAGFRWLFHQSVMDGLLTSERMVESVPNTILGTLIQSLPKRLNRHCFHFLMFAPGNVSREELLNCIIAKIECHDPYAPRCINVVAIRTAISIHT